MSANNRQVGGTHYIASYQHWDLMSDYGVGYLEGCATKYLTRWRKSIKPVMDLEKSYHYLEKILEKIDVGYSNHSHIPSYVLEQFVLANKIEEDIAPLRRILYWTNKDDIKFAMTHIQDLFLLARTMYQPGTPEDGGHYERQWDTPSRR
jgi:hypothetical protein